MNLNKAISDLAQIRAQLDRTESYRGFRSQTLGATALIVMIGALIQHWFFDRGELTTITFLVVWISVALISLSMAVLEMVIRGRMSGNPIVWKMHGRLLTGMFPAFFVGGCLTALIVLDPAGSFPTFHPVDTGNIWALPAVWAMVYSLGIFICSTHLARRSNWVAWYFLIVAVILLVVGFRDPVLKSWHMPCLFGLGQFLFGLVLYIFSERNYGQ